MEERLLLCTDLDRTLLPNGLQPESAGARAAFARLVADPRVTVAYVTGRHRALTQQAIHAFHLPPPDYALCDVGTHLYRIDADDWHEDEPWNRRLAEDWAGRDPDAIHALLADITALRRQEPAKQGRFKLSYYLPPQADTPALRGAVAERLRAGGVRASLVWSLDEPAGIGLLDVLPECADKLRAIEYLRERLGYTVDEVLFAGDSGNDLEALTSPLPAVLVANAIPEVRAAAHELAAAAGTTASLHFAGGGLLGMNGHYGAGILEGVAHFHPALFASIFGPEGEHDE